MPTCEGNKKQYVLSKLYEKQSQERLIQLGVLTGKKFVLCVLPCQFLFLIGTLSHQLNTDTGHPSQYGCDVFRHLTAGYEIQLGRLVRGKDTL